MKSKYIMAILAVVIVMSLLIGTSFEIVSAIYDVDLDGDIDIFDVLQTNIHVPLAYDTQYDVDTDGDVDVFDVLAVNLNVGNTPGEEIETWLDWIINVIWG